MSFGSKLREARQNAKLTQKQLAQIIGAKHNSVSNWENDLNKPDPDTIELICGALSISPNFLLTPSHVKDIDSVVKKYAESTLELQFQTAYLDLINKYRALDEHGVKMVDLVLNMEYERSIKK